MDQGGCLQKALAFFPAHTTERNLFQLLHHPNVVAVTDTGEFDGRPFFVMQYIDGETLDQRIPKEGMRLEHAASILKQIGAALEHVHEKGVFHRDLKPTNIMTFTGPAGVENFWIVWSTTPVAELEAVKSEAAGGLTGDTLVRIKQYLTTKAAETKAITYNYNGNQTAIVRARRDLLVALAQFKHR